MSLRCLVIGSAIVFFASVIHAERSKIEHQALETDPGSRFVLPQKWCLFGVEGSLLVCVCECPKYVISSAFRFEKSFVRPEKPPISSKQLLWNWFFSQ